MSKNAENVNISPLEEGFILMSDTTRLNAEFVRKTYKISALEMELIQFVVLNGPQKMKDVSEHFHIKLSTFTSIIDKAEKHKILKRVNSKDDRRVVFLDVTAKGRKLYDSYRTHMESVFSNVEKNLSGKQYNQFVEGLEKFNRVSLGK